MRSRACIDGGAIKNPMAFYVHVDREKTKSGASVCVSETITAVGLFYGTEADPRDPAKRFWLNGELSMLEHQCVHVCMDACDSNKFITTPRQLASFKRDDKWPTMKILAK